MIGTQLIIVLVLLSLGLPPDEKEGRINFSINGTNTTLWRQFDSEFLARNRDGGPNKWEFYNRLNVYFGLEDFTIGLQMDYDRYEIEEGDSRVEKRYLQYKRNKLQATFGDFYASFGRGTALSVVKTHETYGIENQSDDTIDGGQFSYGSDDFSIDALSGKIETRFEEHTDYVSGIESTIAPFSWLTVGGSAVKTELNLAEGDQIAYGSQVELKLLSGDLIVAHEFTHLDNSIPFNNGAEDGRASYLEVSLLLKDFNFSVEYKDLQNFFAKYSNPPLIENEKQELLADFFAFYPEDLEAAKFRIDYYLPTGTLLYGVAAHYNEKATRHPFYFRYNRDINHFYAGLEHSFLNGTFIDASIGSRNEEGEGYYYQFSGRTTHGSALLSVPLLMGFSTSIDYAFSRFNGDLVRFQRNKLAIGIAQAQLFSATWVWESSNIPGELFFNNGKENFYYTQFDIKLLRRHLIRLIVGENRGGLKCSGGVCKYIPAFSGIRMEGIVRF